MQRAVIIGLLLLVLPLAAVAARPHYRPVPGWPAADGRTAHGYGAAKVSGVATDARGRVFVFQRAETPVLVFGRGGRLLRAWGRGMFDVPHGCRIDPDGNLWLTDLGRHQVLKFTPGGRLLGAYGVEGEPGNDDRHFDMPADVAFGRNGEVYVADGYGNSRVVRLSRDGKFLGAWGRRGTRPGEFNLPHSIATDARGRVYVADRGNGRIQVFTPEGRFLAQWRGMGYVNGLWVTRDQKLLVACGGDNSLSMYRLDGRLIGWWGGTGYGPGRFHGIHMVCSDRRGTIYTAEISTRRVQKFVRR